MFSNEDVTIGAWMLAMNVNHEHNHALCEPDCTPSSIAVWDIPQCSGFYLPGSFLPGAWFKSRMKLLYESSQSAR